MTLGVTCHHCPWTAHTVERRRVWHVIIAFGQHRQSNGVAWHANIAFRQHKRSNDVWRGMPSSPLGSINGRTTSGVACHHRLWAAHVVKQRRVWHAITACGLDDKVGRRQARHAFIALGRQTWSNDVGRGMPSLPLGSTDGRTASGVACHHRLWEAHTVERR